MKILLITLEYPPFKGGVANYYAGLVKHFPGETVVLHNNDGQLLSSWLYPRWLPAVWRLFWAVRKERPDWVLAGQVLPLGTAALIVRRLLGFRFALFVNGMDLHWSQKQPRKARLARRVLSACDRVIANSSYSAELAENLGAGEDKAEVVHPGLDLPAFDPAEEEGMIGELAEKYWFVRSVRDYPKGVSDAVLPPASSAESPSGDSAGASQTQIVFSLGRLVRRKGFDRLIKAWPTVIEACPDAVLAIAGTGPDEEYLKKQAAKLSKDIRDNIVFLGKVNDKEKWVWYRLCDLFALPARDLDGDVEGFGIVYLEANARGRAVLAGDSGGVRDAVEEEESGLLCDPESEDDIADRIIYLLKRPEERRRMGEEGMMRAVARFNARRQGERLFKILLHNA